MINKLLCSFEKCGGELKSADNGKSPMGLFECKKCHSEFRMVVVRNSFDVHKPIPLKPKVKKVKVKVKVDED